MKIKVMKDKFLKSIRLSLKGYIKLKAINNTLILTTINEDLKIEINSFIDCITIEEGECYTLGNKLPKLIDTIKTNEIELETIEDKLIIKAGNTKIELETKNIKLPELETKEIKSITINGKEFIEALNSIKSSRGDFIRGFLMEINKENITFVATDAYQISIYSIENKNNTIEDNLMFKNKIIDIIPKEIEGDVKIEFNESNITLNFKTPYGKFNIKTTQLEEKFPDYKTVIPKNMKTKIVINKKLILNALNLIAKLVDDITEEYSLFEIKENKLTIKDMKLNTIEEINLNNFTGEPLSIGIDNKRLKNLLKNISGDEIELGFIDKESPIQVKYPNKENFLYFLRPVKF